MTVFAPALPGADVRSTYDALAPFYDRFTAEHDYELWTRELEDLARRHGARGRRLLDLACGTGKSFAPFLARGYSVTACDISPEMLRVAATRAGGEARLLERDIRRLDRLGAFDLVCCLDDAVNYVLSPQELEATFAGLACNLAPGGVVVFDANSLVSYRTFFATMTVIAGDGHVLVWDGHASADLGPGALVQATLEAITRREDGSWQRERSDHLQRHHPRATVECALGRAGLRAVAVHGMHLDGSTTGAFDELDNSKAVYVACAA